MKLCSRRITAEDKPIPEKPALLPSGVRRTGRHEEFYFVILS
jgi:hypothetical protein